MSCLKLLSVLLLTFIISTVTMAEPSERSSDASELFQHVQQSYRDGTDITGLGILLGGIFTTSLAHQYDQKTRDAYRDNQKFSNDVSRFGAVWGSGGPGIMIALSQIAFDTRNGMAHAESIAFTSVTHISIAAMVRRGRPANPESWTSFPSGHSASAWSTATSLSYAYGWKAAIPAYAAALMTMGARISDDRHWLSDTVAGATLGLFWGRATSFHEQNGSTKWVPFVSHQGLGLGVRYDF